MVRLPRLAGSAGFGARRVQSTDALWRGIPGSDAKRERIRAQARRREQIPRWQQSQRQTCTHAPPRVAKKPSTIDQRALGFPLSHRILPSPLLCARRRMIGGGDDPATLLSQRVNKLSDDSVRTEPLEAGWPADPSKAEGRQSGAGLSLRTGADAGKTLAVDVCPRLAARHAGTGLPTSASAQVSTDASLRPTPRAVPLRGRRASMARSNDHIGVDDQEFYQLLDKDGVADDIRLFNKTLRHSLALRSDPPLFRVRTQAEPALRFCCH